MNEKILVTGGTGYIGSHTVVELINEGYEVEVLDNLYNSKITVLDKIKELTGVKPRFHEVDLLDAEKVNHVFQDGNFSAVIHFAGLKAVGESVEKPLEYYENNITGTLNLLKAMRAHDVKKIIFSSSATVYGDPGTPKYVESMPTGQNLSSPYGKTKYMIEEILKDFAVAWPKLEVAILRYFNPIGNHPSGLLGEDPNGIPLNLMPIIMKVAKGDIKELSVYGNDFSTPDGTCRRDYIHVVDLVKGHLAALEHLRSGVSIYNLGSGTPTSVTEMIAAFEAASGKKLPHRIAERRAGDLAEFWADPAKAKAELNWQVTLTVADAMRDTLKFLNSQK